MRQSGEQRVPRQSGQTVSLGPGHRPIRQWVTPRHNRTPLIELYSINMATRYPLSQLDPDIFGGPKCQTRFELPSIAAALLPPPEASRKGVKTENRQMFHSAKLYLI